VVDLGVARAVRDVFVTAVRRRAGIAKALMAALEQTAQDRGMHRIGLMVTLDEDHGPARSLYQSLGYEKAHGPFVSSVTLQTDAGPRPVLGVADYLVKEL
jgi:GNAT superfamily N-acetyltransferase